MRTRYLSAFAVLLVGVAGPASAQFAASRPSVHLFTTVTRHYEAYIGDVTIRYLETDYQGTVTAYSANPYPSIGATANVPIAGTKASAGLTIAGARPFFAYETTNELAGAQALTFQPVTIVQILANVGYELYSRPMARGTMAVNLVALGGIWQATYNAREVSDDFAGRSGTAGGALSITVPLTTSFGVSLTGGGQVVFGSERGLADRVVANMQVERGIYTPDNTEVIIPSTNRFQPFVGLALTVPFQRQ